MFGMKYTKLASLIILLFLVSCESSTSSTPTTQKSYLIPYDKDDPNACPEYSAQGIFEYQTPVEGAFTGTLKVSGLIPDHWYKFSINGWWLKSGNSNLANTCDETYDKQGYCDFPVEADKAGEINEQVSWNLPSGKYTIKFLMKDPMQKGYCVLLYDDNAPQFKIK